MKGVNTNLYTCMSLCRNFAKGGDEVAVFKKGVAADYAGPLQLKKFNFSYFFLRQ